jgi:hypothetical protein
VAGISESDILHLACAEDRAPHNNASDRDLVGVMGKRARILERRVGRTRRTCAFEQCTGIIRCSPLLSSDIDPKDDYIVFRKTTI